MSAPRPRSAAPLVAALFVLLAGCTGGAKEQPTAEPSSPSTPLTSYDTSAVVITRGPFCEQVPETAVEDALGEAPSKVSDHDNGERVRLTGDVKDVSHEYGCTYRGANGMTARAWLFAPPVTPARARDLVRDALAPGCAGVERADYGRPSIATRCGSRGFVEEGYRGLFGDAWLSCTLAFTGPEQPHDLTERADRWCVQVVEAASAG